MRVTRLDAGLHAAALAGLADTSCSSPCLSFLISLSPQADQSPSGPIDTAAIRANIDAATASTDPATQYGRYLDRTHERPTWVHLPERQVTFRVTE